MPKTFPIMIEVEEIALGPVLRRLNDMPGIAKLHLDLGHGEFLAAPFGETDVLHNVILGGGHDLSLLVGKIGLARRKAGTFEMAIAGALTRCNQDIKNSLYD